MKFSYKNIYSKPVIIGDISFYPQQERVYKKRRANFEKAVKDGVLSLSIDGQPPHPSVPPIPPPPDLSNLPEAVDQLSQRVGQVASSVTQLGTKVQDTKQALQDTQTLIGQVNSSVQETKSSINTVQGNVDNFSLKVDQVKTEINQLKSDVNTLKANQGSGGGSGSGTPPPVNAKVEPNPNSIPQRTATGALKVTTAVEENEATTLKQVTEHVDAKVQGLKTTLTQDIQTAKTESIQAAENRVQALVNGAPDEFDTLKELADALKEDKTGIQAINTALSERYTKTETDAKIDEKADAKINNLFEGIADEDYKTIPKIAQKAKAHDGKLGVIEQTLLTLATKDSVTQGIAQLKTELVDGASDGFSTLKKVESKVTALQDSIGGSAGGGSAQKCPVNPEFCFDTLVANKVEVFKTTDKEIAEDITEIVDLSAHKGSVIYLEVESKRTPDPDASNNFAFVQLEIKAGNHKVFSTESDFDLPNSSNADESVVQKYKVTLPWRGGSIKLQGYTVTSYASLTTKVSVKIEKDTAGVVIDGAGHGHGETEAGVSLVEDATLGGYFHFYKTKMKHPSFEFSRGMAWSHSRWFRLDSIQESENDCYLWEYGNIDFAFCDKNIGSLSNKYIKLYSRLRVYLSGRLQDYRYSCGIVGNLKLDTWYHLIVMHQLTDKSLQSIVYLNNKKVIEKAETGLSVSSQPIAEYFCEMGRRRSNKISYMYGDQANILFFKRLLTPEEMTWLYNNPVYYPKSYHLHDYRVDEYMKAHP